MLSTWGFYLIYLLIKCYISLASSFLTFLAGANNSNTLSIIATDRLNIRPWSTVSITSMIDDFQIKSLGELSTNFDVLKALQATKQFAPYVGSQGVAVITGGTGGIGLPTVDAIARTGMKIILCTREEPSVVRGILKHLLSESIVDDNINIQQMDLSDLASVEAAAQEIIRTEKRIDLLLNCAGISSIPSRQLTAQNFEMHLGVNHIAHHFWTRALVPIMRPWGRIVTVSSQAHSKVRNLELDDLNYSVRRYCSYGAYCQSKLSNILFSKALQDRISSKSTSSILSLSVHPGRVLTNLWKSQQPGSNLLLHAVSEYISTKSPEQGASSIVYCCLADSIHFQQGDFIVDCNSNTPSDIALNKQIRKRLWDETEKMIEESGFHMPPAIV